MAKIRWLNGLIWNLRATIGLSIFLLVVYGLQLLVAGSLESHAAHQVVQDWIQPNAGVYLLVSPLVHSYHGHIIRNLTWLIPSGALTEQIVSRRWYVVFVNVAGALSNFLPPFVHVGGFGVGISGVFVALWTFIGVVTVHRGFSSQGILRFALYLFAGLLVLLFFPGQAVGQWAGYLDVPSGTATGAHLLGALFGGALGGWWIVNQVEYGVRD